MNVNEIIKQMTLEEKVKLLTGRGRWKFNGIPRLGIREVVCSDGPHGLRAFENFDGESNIQPATLFPCAAAMASTWNLDLIKRLEEPLVKNVITIKLMFYLHLVLMVKEIH